MKKKFFAFADNNPDIYTHKRTQETYKMSTASIIISSIIFSVCLIDLTFAVTRSVYRLKYFGTTPQLVTSDTLAWETYTGDEKQLKYAVEAGRFTEQTNDVSFFLFGKLQILFF